MNQADKIKIKMIVERKLPGDIWETILFPDLVPGMLIRFRDPVTNEIVVKEAIALPGVTKFIVMDKPIPFTESENPNTDWSVEIEPAPDPINDLC